MTERFSSGLRVARRRSVSPWQIMMERFSSGLRVASTQCVTMADYDGEVLQWVESCVDAVGHRGRL